MADGIDAGQIGDAITRGLMLRYQARVQAQRDQQTQALAGLRARQELLGRLTLSQPGGGAAPYSAYAAALGGADLPGITAQPTPVSVATVRAGAQDSASQQRTHATLVQNLKNYDTSKWTPDDYGAYFGTGQLPAGAKPIPKPASKGTGRGAGKTPEEKLIAEQTRLDTELKTQMAQDAARMGGSVRASSPQTMALQQQLAAVKQKIAALQGTGGGGAPAAGPYGASVVRNGVTYIWNAQTGKYHPAQQ